MDLAAVGHQMLTPPPFPTQPDTPLHFFDEQSPPISHNFCLYPTIGKVHVFHDILHLLKQEKI